MDIINNNREKKKLIAMLKLTLDRYQIKMQKDNFVNMTEADIDAMLHLGRQLEEAIAWDETDLDNNRPHSPI